MHTNALPSAFLLGRFFLDDRRSTVLRSLQTATQACSRRSVHFAGDLFASDSLAGEVLADDRETLGDAAATPLRSRARESTAETTTPWVTCPPARGGDLAKRGGARGGPTDSPLCPDGVCPDGERPEGERPEGVRPGRELGPGESAPRERPVLPVPRLHQPGLRIAPGFGCGDGIITAAAAAAAAVGD